MQQSDGAWPKTWTSQIGQTVARLRKEARLSQAALCAACENFGYPIPRHTIASLETGRRRGLDLHELVVIAAALQVSPAELLFPHADETLHRTEDGDEAPEPTLEYFPNDFIPMRLAWARFVGSAAPHSERLAEAHRRTQEATRLLQEVLEMEKERG